ncbi:protein GRIM REAPER-like [Nymphaea colorata]|uniref:protein GRIM REAPER-like n=1 Tax=Nymphaea colorata TaxID=210225 RepID=UPI00129D5ABE|nr:protein GRIM REAPER-like [Nymphaea colorata]
MKSFTLLFVVIVFIDICHSSYGSGNLGSNDASLGAASNESISRLLAQSAHAKARGASCKKYPFVCRLRGSAGPDCCKSHCVNTFTDKSNCGRCGKKCKHGETCCGGQCVHLSFNKSHCGRCFNRCSNGDSCSYGLCGYA